jgi:hypothetical protein
VNDPTRAHYEETVYRVLARNGVPDPGAALCALLWLLRDRHHRDVTAFATKAYRQDFELPDPGARTVAEELRDRATNLKSVSGHGRPAMVCATDSPAPGMQAVADVLAELIPLWDAEMMDDAATVRHGGTAAPGRAD